MEKGVVNLMSDKRLARRVVLKLKFENVDVPENIALHLVSASYTDNEDGSTDKYAPAHGRHAQYIGRAVERHHIAAAMGTVDDSSDHHRLPCGMVAPYRKNRIGAIV